MHTCYTYNYSAVVWFFTIIFISEVVLVVLMVRSAKSVRVKFNLPPSYFFSRRLRSQIPAGYLIGPQHQDWQEIRLWFLPVSPFLGVPPGLGSLDEFLHLRRRVNAWSLLWRWFNMITPGSPAPWRTEPATLKHLLRTCVCVGGGANLG
jgi:hypothetical protein